MEAARSPLQARCVHLARMGCVVFHYDMIGYADSQQITYELAHRFAKQRSDWNDPQDWGFFSPQAESRFQSITPIEVTPQTILLGKSNVDVQGNTRLRGIRTDYDGWPLIGSLAQSIASSRYESVAPQTNRVANRRIRAAADDFHRPFGRAVRPPATRCKGKGPAVGETARP